MFQVILDMPNGTHEVDVESAMPSWWMVDNTPERDVLIVYNDSATQNPAGTIKRFPNKIIVRVDEKALLGQKFWDDFAMRYPEMNPYASKIGVLCLTDPDNEVFELDDLPSDLPSGVLDKVAAYAKTKNAYFVEYLLGNWHPNSEITVTNYKQILKNGRLGRKMSARVFKLGISKN